jgi:hypothetical protein
MRISHSHEFLFFSNPKTGSESVRELLDPYSDIKGTQFWNLTPDHPFYSHISQAETKALFLERGWDFDSYFKFTFVRNPWARLVSLYEMIYGGRGRRLGFAGRLDRGARALLGLHPSVSGFRRWLPRTRPDGPGGGGPPDQRWQVYGTYSIRSYVSDSHGEILVDQIIRLEDIDEDLPVLLREIGLADAAKMLIPRKNIRRHAPYRDYYDDRCRELVRERYAYDIETFGYRFDG